MRSTTTTVLAACALTMACASSAQKPEHIAAHSACERLPEAKEALAAFYSPGNVYTANPAEEDLFIGRASVPVRTTGAELYMHAQPGLDESYVERVLRCHTARRQAAHPNDPLVPDVGLVADVEVRPAGQALVVRVVGEDAATAAEIWRRAQAFASPTSVRVEQIAASSAVSGGF